MISDRRLNTPRALVREATSRFDLASHLTSVSNVLDSIACDYCFAEMSRAAAFSSLWPNLNFAWFWFCED